MTQNIKRLASAWANRVAKSANLAIAALALMGLAAGACGVDLANPPRVATATARASAPATSTPQTLVLSAPGSQTASEGSESATPDPDAGSLPASALTAEALTVWVNEGSPEHRRVMDELAAEFSDRYGIDVAIQLVSPSLLPDLVSTSVLSGTLPDVILHPIEYTAGWVAGDVLDPSASDEVVDQIGRDTFDPAALDLLTIDGQIAALPTDGYHQLLIYRTDWFDRLNLDPPVTYSAMAAAAERINDPEAIISGLVIPTESNLVTTHQAFEQLALANGCRLISDEGEVTILEPACRTALEHYFTTINRYSPSGVQTDTSARNAFLNGQTGMIISSPAILPELAGLNPSALPACPECDETIDGINYLARNSGILTEVEGPGGTLAAFGNIRNLGITTTADREAAQTFAAFWFSEGYERWLAIDSERKVPMRLGTAENPTAYIDSWGTTPLAASTLSLVDIYGEQTVERLRDGIASAPRWGIREGYGALMTALYDDFVISIVLQEMLSGYFGTETTLREAYRRTVELIPNYGFPVILDEEEESP